MNTRVVLAAVGLLLPLGLSPKLATQQLVPTAPPDHIHFYVPDPEKSLVWYMNHFGGMRVKDPRPNQPDELLYDKTVFRFSKRDNSMPNDGCVLDRVGFTVDDVDAKVNELTKDGAKVLQKPGAVAFLADPWGGKIEVLHPDNQSTNRLFLVALRSTDPAALEKWMQGTFGGAEDKLLGRIDGIRYGGIWVIFQKSDAVTADSRGHVIDHLGWAIPDMTVTMAAAKKRGYKVVREPFTAAPLTFAHIEGPNGLDIELTQFPR